MRIKIQRLLVLFLLILTSIAYGQSTSERLISGVVKDDKGTSLQSITVTEKGTSNVVITNERGMYSIRVKPSAFLVFTGVGLESQEIKASSNVMDITLRIESKSLSDVVVVGYGSQKKAKVTGAVASLTMDSLLGDRPVASLGALLQGATPGLEVTIGSGQPGASTSWNIRGGTDFGTGAAAGINNGSPFIIVDNVPFNGPTNLLDPNDIESVTVLKDAGSASIYGSRSAFGVVVITTKSGKKNQKARFTYSNNIVFSNPTNLPEKATPLQQVQAWIDGGMTTYNGNQNLAKWKDMLLEYQQNPGKYPLGGDTVSNIYYQLAPTDAVQALLGNTSIQQMHNFSVSGGSDKTTYRFSFGATNENGILVPQAHQDNYKRYNIKSVVSSDVYSWLNLQLDAGYNNSTANSPFYTNAFGDATNTPSALPLDSIPQKYPGQIIKTARNEIMAQAPITTLNGDVRVTGRTVIKPFSGMSVTGEYTIDNLNTQTTNYDKKPSTLFLNPYGYTPEPIGNDKFQKINSMARYKAINVFANYVRSFGLHNFTLMGGFNQEESHSENQAVVASGLLSPDLPFLSGTTGLIPPTTSDNYTDWSTRGFFGRLNYDYRSKYLFQLNYRSDGSSKFPEGHRWVGLPSGSIGWRVMEENFMQFLKPYVNEFKLRASYGSVGNQNIGDYQYFGGMAITIPNWLYNSNRIGSITPPPLVSTDFTWETVETKDLGFDWGILRNRLTGTFDWYQRDTKDILTTNATPTPAVLGTGVPLQNSGALRTKGFELQANWRDKIGKVNYYIGANLYNYESTVTNAVNAQNVITGGYLYVGKKMGEIWGYTTDRFYNEEDFVKGTLNSNLRGGTLVAGVPKQGNQAPNPGDIVYKDLDSNGVINSGAGTLANHGDLQVIGNSTPQYQYGITGGVSFAHFDFSFVIMGVGKQDLWINNTLTFPNQWVSYGALYANETNYWTPTNRDAYYGRIYSVVSDGGIQANNQIVQTKFLTNGAYTRIKNVTLRYTFPSSLFKKAYLSNLQVFGSVENLYTFTHLPKGMDPDVAVQGGTVGGGLGYPFMRKMSVGVNLSF
jgi:TonB-linked SusC/RagA family outer membrane protein